MISIRGTFLCCRSFSKGCVRTLTGEAIPALGFSDASV